MIYVYDISQQIDFFVHTGLISRTVFYNINKRLLFNWFGLNDDSKINQ